MPKYKDITCREAVDLITLGCTTVEKWAPNYPVWSKRPALHYMKQFGFTSDSYVYMDSVNPGAKYRVEVE